jgi:DNA-binding HxlR family transcriptional regulator
MESELKCPVKATEKALAGKWKVQIVWYLGLQSQRFAELRNLLPGVSEKVLTEHLRQLENAGILERIVTASAPPRVGYKLTAAGRDLVPVMQAMVEWGSKHMGIVPNLPEPPHRNERLSDLEFKAIS